MTWNEALHLSEPQFVICKIGMICATLGLRTRKDTLRAPSTKLSLILFLDLRGARCGVGQSVPRGCSLLPNSEFLLGENKNNVITIEVKCLQEMSD